MLFNWRVAKKLFCRKILFFKWFSKLLFLLCLLESFIGFSRVRNYILFITRPGHQALNRILNSRFNARGHIMRLNELGQTFVVRLLMRLKYKDGHKARDLSRWMIFSPHVRWSKRALDSGFHTVDSGFHVCVFRIPHPRVTDSISDWIPDFKILFWIPDSINWIPVSKAMDSGFYRPKLPGFRIPDYLTWGESFVVCRLSRTTKASFVKTDDDWCASCFCYFENEMAWLKPEQIPHLVSLVNLICW